MFIVKDFTIDFMVIINYYLFKNLMGYFVVVIMIYFIIINNFINFRIDQLKNYFIVKNKSIIVNNFIVVTHTNCEPKNFIINSMRVFVEIIK